MVRMLERIDSYIREHGLIEPGGEVTCLVSGGADSTCLWHALGELGYRVSALHVAHGLRGAESDEDARFCREAFGAEIVEASGSTEAELRDLRYSLRDRPAARNRSHRLGPGRVGAARSRRVRLAAADQGAARGRRRPAAARCLARGGARVVRRAWAGIPRGLVESRHEARPDPCGDPAAARAARSARASLAALARGRSAASPTGARARARGAARSIGKARSRPISAGASARCASTTRSGSRAR